MNICLKMAAILMGIMLMVNTSSLAQKGIGNLTGMTKNNSQPKIETIDGTLDHIKTEPCEHSTGNAYIGTHLFIKTGENDQLLNVHLGAAYALESFVSELEIGQSIQVHGFQTAEMEAFEYIAKDITSDGYTLQIRDENLRPFWAGDRNFSRGRHHGRHSGRW